MDKQRTKERLSPERRRMRKVVAEFQRYVATYSDQQHYDTCSDRRFIDDMLYGIGIALDEVANHAAPGYDRFKGKLREHLNGK